MSWQYSQNPATSAKDYVRFLIGDTDPTDPILYDGEILFLLSQCNNSPINASIRACEQVMTKFARLADESVGSVRITFSQKSKAYKDMKEALRQRLATEDMIPYAGGISKSDKTTQVQNTDRVVPDFRKHIMENEQISPWVSQSFEDFLLYGL